MPQSEFGRLLGDLWNDLRDPSILWQAAAVAACVAAAWWLARRLQLRAPEESAPALQRGAAALRRVAFPLIAVALLAAARAALEGVQSVNLLSVAIPLFAALAGIRFAVYLLRIAFASSRSLDAFERSLALTVWALVALHLTGLLPDIVQWLDRVELPAGKARVSLWALASAAFWVALTLLFALWAGAALEVRLMRAEALHSSLRVVFARLGRALLLLVAVLVALPLVGVDLTVLSVFGGALGVGLGLGLQKIASNYVSGFILLLDRSIRLGDVITADGQHGVVTGITTRYVVLRALSGVEAIIPNDTLVTSTVLNHSYSDRNVRLAARVPVGWGSDLPAVLRMLEDAARGCPRVLAHPPPAAHVVGLGDAGVELELGFWIADPENGTQNVRSAVLLRAIDALKAAGVEIPFPKRNLASPPAGAGA
ncbi:MAG: mechanosensitive ion channel [Burkholderiales bacterium]|nr:mechanosensitive ion channel [Burkholderiales bacterium]